MNDFDMAPPKGKAFYYSYSLPVIDWSKEVVYEFVDSDPGPRENTG